MTNVTLFEDLLGEVGRLLAEGPDRDGVLQAVCELLRRRVEHYAWVGFYLADSAAGTLALGPYAGEPTDHVEIPFGRGICGQAAERETLVVQDVSKETNYLSCSPSVRSEIVTCVMRAGEIVAELDVDSHALSPFTPDDRAFLERVAKAVSELF